MYLNNFHFMLPSNLAFDLDSISEPLWAILRLGYGSKNVLGSTHVVELLSFSMFPSILTFDFDLILG